MTQVHRALGRIVSLVLLGVLAAGTLLADEPVRRVQEELRRRNLFFGDVDGRVTPELISALRLYQAHKGFECTGQIDNVTARSLEIDLGPAAASVEPTSTRARWPDVPVLKSDAARELPPAKQTELREAAVAHLDVSPPPEIPAEAPSGPQNLDPEKVTRFVEEYLRDNETNDLATQLKYYAYPLDYFDHGRVGEKFVAKDNRNYMRRWPERKYALLGTVKFAAGPNDQVTLVEFPISFHVRSRTREASGKTRNFWTIKPEGDALKIVAIREEHLRE